MKYFLVLIIGVNFCRAELICQSAFQSRNDSSLFAVATTNDAFKESFLLYFKSHFFEMKDLNLTSCPSNNKFSEMRILIQSEKFEEESFFVRHSKCRYAARYLLHNGNSSSLLTKPALEMISLFDRANKSIELRLKQVADQITTIFLYYIGCLIGSFLLHEAGVSIASFVINSIRGEKCEGLPY